MIIFGSECLDSFGRWTGDSAPDSVVNGCIDAVNEADGFGIVIRRQNKITEILNKRVWQQSY